MGPFTVAPATGILINTGFVPVTIEYSPEAPGKHEEEIFIDITDREFTKSPNGIVYRLTGEACYPSIVNSIEIFEEHTIIPNITVLDPKLVRFSDEWWNVWIVVDASTFVPLDDHGSLC